jgi:hypothetical protein
MWLSIVSRNKLKYLLVVNIHNDDVLYRKGNIYMW